jgi:RimJ/RimL family protein N-acetyltransferase
MLTFRLADLHDADLYFEWANDELVRQFSYSKENITYENHIAWFKRQLTSGMTFLYLFEDDSNVPVGQVRIQMSSNNTAVIGVSTARMSRGLGYGSQFIRIASYNFLLHYPNHTLHAYIMKENKASLKVFIKAGFTILSEKIVDGVLSNILYKKTCEL